MEFDIVTICNKKRKPLIEKYLKDISHITHYSKDYDLPENWRVNPVYKGLAIFMHQHIGHMRCCYGHRDALLKTTKDYILVLEDDAIPNVFDWFDIVKNSIPLLDQFELVSLHGREFDPTKFLHMYHQSNGLNLLIPKDRTSPRRVLGSLAYIVRKDMIQRFVDFTYQGMGQDLFICNCFNFALIHPSPFDHDRVNSKSLIDK